MSVKTRAEEDKPKRLLPPGKYDVLVVGTQDRWSRGGRPYRQVHLMVLDPLFHGRELFSYVTEEVTAAEWVWREVAYSIGKIQQGNMYRVDVDITEYNGDRLNKVGQYHPVPAHASTYHWLNKRPRTRRALRVARVSQVVVPVLVRTITSLASAYKRAWEGQ